MQYWQTFSIKDQLVNILGFAGYTVSVTTIQLCLYSMKTAIDRTYMNECGYVPSSKTLFTETIGKPDMAHSHSFPDPWSGV